MMALLLQGNRSIEVQFRYQPSIAVPMPGGAYWQQSREIDITPLCSTPKLRPGPAVISIYGMSHHIILGFRPDGAVFGRL
jgi:hypothetical protein